MRLRSVKQMLSTLFECLWVILQCSSHYPSLQSDFDITHMAQWTLSSQATSFRSHLRLCIDYRALNDAPITDPYPLPRTDDILSRMQGCK